MKNILENIENDILLSLKEKKLNISDDMLLSGYYGLLISQKNSYHTLEIAFNPKININLLSDILTNIQIKYKDYILKVTFIKQKNVNFNYSLKMKIILRTLQKVRESKIKDILNEECDINLRKECSDASLDKIIKFKEI